MADRSYLSGQALALAIMPYRQLHAVLPDLAEAETRSMTLFEGGEPRGTYHPVEMFCDEPGCDCRRAFIQVF